MPPAKYRCPLCGRVLDRDPNDGLFTGWSYCSRKGRDAYLDRLLDGEE
jgi:hypothetical protein